MTPEGWNIHSTSLLLFTVVTAHDYNSRNAKYIALCTKFHTCIGTKQRFTGHNLSGFLATTGQDGRKREKEGFVRMICSSGVYLTTSRDGQWLLWLCNFSLWFVKESRTPAPSLWQVAHIVYAVISEYLCRREETWQVMSNRLLKSISSFRDTTIF